MKRLANLRIRDVRHLSAHLGTNPRELRGICQSIGAYYVRRDQEIKGKVRRLAIPKGRLRAILARLADLLQRVDLPDWIQGGRRGFSNITNARRHLRCQLIVKTDLKDFFPSVPSWRVYRVFVERLGCTPDVARCLTRLTTLDGSLPQGSPTSLILAALSAEPLSRRLRELARSRRSEFTQYVDDLTFSGGKHVRNLLEPIDRIVRQEGFQLRKEKIEVVPLELEQIVTGVRVDGGVDAPRRRHVEVRERLAAIRDARPGKDGVRPPGVQPVQGLIAYIRQLNPGAGKTYAAQFRRAIGKRSSSPDPCKRSQDPA